jgi:hypothetical protein
MLSLSLGLSLTSGQGGGAPAELIDPTTLFDSDTGFIFDLSDAGTVFQEVAGTTTPSTNGDPLGTLLDLSGNDNHVDAINTSLRPNYVFDGSVGYADFNATAALDILQKAFTLAQPLTIIVSVRVDTTDLGEFFVDGGASSGLSFDLGTGPTLRFNAGGFLDSSQSITFGVNFVATGIADGASSKVAVNANAFTEGNAGANDPGGITFGANIAGSTPVPMRLYRAIGIGRVLTDQEIADARAWCAAPAGVSL